MRKLCFLLCTLFCFAIASAQTRTVKGTVVYAGDDEPLVGATVLPVGAGQGTATDIDGKFVLNVPSSVSKLKVSYVGMTTEEVSLVGTPPYNLIIKLNDTENKLDEVMVVAYGVAKKSAYTGAASVIDASVIEDRLVSNLTNALSGTVAGVQTLSANGQPGEASKVRIRGVGSINASMAPLYVLDGMPYDGDITGLNPSDIESMTVLKDAAAAALYGARGANGVILITTKRGKDGKAKVTFDARWGANSREITNYDVIESPAQFMELAYQAKYNNGRYNLGYSPDAAYKYAAANQLVDMTGYRLWTLPEGQYLIGRDGKLNPNAVLGYSNGTNYFTPDNWTDGSYRKGLRQEYNLSVSGGNDKMNFFVSGSYLKDEGVIKNSSYERLSTRGSLEYQVNNWLKIGTNMAYSFGKSQYPDDMDENSTSSSGNAFFVANSIAPIYPLYVRDASGNIMYNEAYGHAVYDYGDGKSTSSTRAFMSQANPISQLLYDKTEYLTDLFNGKWFAEISPVTGLKITGSVGLTVQNQRLHQVLNPLYGQFADMGGQAIQVAERTKGLNLQALANYNRTFWEYHTFDFLLGYESYEWNNEYTQALGSNLYDPMSWPVNNTLANNDRKGYGAYLDYATRGIFGRINYDFDSRYFFSFSYRRDASSRFAPDKRWGDFFSVSAAWDVAQEKFMESTTTWLDRLKLRASFGQQGNDNLQGEGVSNTGYYYAYLDQYTISGADSWSDGTLYFKGNPDITWEKSNSFNVGIDFSFLKSKISGSAEYFNRETTDMLYNKPVAPSLGYASIPMNIGSMRNYGFEVELTYLPINTRDITWSITGNITFINNKVLKLAPELGGELKSGSRIYREGESMYQFDLVKYAGVDAATGKPLFWAWKKDENGNRIPGSDYPTPVYSTEWRQASGDLLPTAYGGISTSLKAYGFDLSIACAYQFGGKIWDEGYQLFMGSGTSSSYGHNWHVDILDAWTPTNQHTSVPRLDTGDTYSFYDYTTDRVLVSSNYFSINNITLGYTIPERLTKRIGIESVRVYGTADNLALFSARKGLDPRQSYTIATTSLYTAMRCISGGIKVVF